MTVVLFIVVLLVLVVGHELGHFLAAKASKMKVLEFGVGFPPKIFGKKVGETEYTLNWLPFGGFVRLFGEDPREADSPEAFSKHHPLKQVIVLFAGPFANIVLAVLFTAGALMIGAPSLIDEAQVSEAQDVRVLVGEVLPESPAADVGIMAGDEVVSVLIAGEQFDVRTPAELSDRIGAATGDVALSLLRSGETLEVVAMPQAGLIETDLERRAIGISMALVGTVSLPPHEALVKGVENTYRNTILITAALGGLIVDAFTLSADVSNLAGPVGIANLTGEAASFGFGALLTFAALLSINLAIINLLPFPALDGGRLLFLGIEAVSRKKIPLSVAGTLNTVGFALLILLMIAITIQDIGRLWG